MRRVIFLMLVVLSLLGLALSACASSSPKTGALQLEEHPLTGAPNLTPLQFQPVNGTQEEVLAKHASDRAAVISAAVTTVDGNPAISSLGDNGDLLAVLTTSAQGPQQTVTVSRGSEVVFETDAGLPSPVLPLQGLWTYGDHWALEILFAGQSTFAGQVFIDGQSLNEQKGYSETFGFQLLAGKPFFFYSRDGHAGYSYDGQESDLTYTEIPHYRCCGESMLNPIPARNMVAFFAQQNGTWFYVELGILGK